MFPKAQCPPLTRSPPDHTQPSQTHALIFFFFTWVRGDRYIRPVLGEGRRGWARRPSCSRPHTSIHKCIQSERENPGLVCPAHRSHISPLTHCKRNVRVAGGRYQRAGTSPVPGPRNGQRAGGTEPLLRVGEAPQHRTPARGASTRRAKRARNPVGTGAGGAARRLAPHQPWGTGGGEVERANLLRPPTAQVGPTRKPGASYRSPPASRARRGRAPARRPSRSRSPCRDQLHIRLPHRPISALGCIR